VTHALFHVIVLHHASDSMAGARVDALRRAFENVRSEDDASTFAPEADPWSLVGFIVVSNPTEFEARTQTVGRRVLFVILVNERMVDDPEWASVLEIVASVLPRSGLQNALCFVSSEEAQARLPGRLRERQAPESSVLGERRMRPHTLALLALHRARLLVGASPERNTLKLFISHAKADGLFLAHSLVSLLKEVPELNAWYDAIDLQSGAAWSDDIEAEASSSVLIAIRTEGYDQSPWCRNEFETALAHGVPIIVVDALLRPVISPSTLPFAAMPNVRVPDGNTHRVLAAALREHLRMLLVETLVVDHVPPNIPLTSWRVWPRLPTISALQARAATIERSEYWLLPQAIKTTRDFTAAREWLAATQSYLHLEAVETFLLVAGTLDVQPSAPLPPEGGGPPGGSDRPSS